MSRPNLESRCGVRSSMAAERRTRAVVTLAIGFDHGALPFDADNVFSETRVIGIAVVSGHLWHGSPCSSLELGNVRSYALPTNAPGPKGEGGLLRLVSDEVRTHERPVILTWGGDSFAVPLLRHRGFSVGVPIDWLPPSQVAPPSFWDTARHVDVRRCLYPEGVAPSLEEALRSIGVMPWMNSHGVQRLEILAIGVLVLAARTLWHAGLCDAQQYHNSMEAMTDRVAALAEERPHLRAWLQTFDEPADREQST